MTDVPEGDCTYCGKCVRLHIPRRGDGSTLLTYWHKDPNDRSRWCRSELDDGIRWVEDAVARPSSWR